MIFVLPGLSAQSDFQNQIDNMNFFVILNLADHIIFLQDGGNNDNVIKC